MNSMKRIISVILALSMLFSMFVMVNAEGTGATTQAVKYAKEIEIIKAMGIINGDETGAINADANLTRAEFAQVLTVLLQINYSEVAKENAWYYTFKIPEDLDNVLLTPNSGLITGTEETPSAPVEVEKVQKFADVPTSHWAYNVISQITDIGYMIGTSENEFSPEEPVTVNQVNKVLVKILGYEQFAMQNGGYPAGYNYLASSLKVLKSINNYGETPITRGELAKMLYNMFDVNMIETTQVNDDGVATYQTSEDTFLNDVLGIYKYEGKVTDNGTTAILGNSSIEKDEIKIGNSVFKLSPKAEYVKGFIGRYVEFYAVKDEESDDMTVIYAGLSKDSEEFTVEIKDFADLKNGKLEFYDDNEKKDFVDVATVPTIIFNGSKVESITKEEIKDFSNGTVTAMKSGESKMYDTIVIEGFVSVYVKNIIASEKIVSNGLIAPGTSSDYVSLDLSEENNKTREITYIKDGKAASFEDIMVKSVIDVALSKNAIKIVISDKKASFKVNGKTVDEFGDSYIYAEDGTEYIIAKELVNSNSMDVPDLGADITAYINTFGEIAAVDTAVAALSELGIIINASTEGRGLKKANKVRIFTQAGAFVDYELADKVGFTDSADNYKKDEAEDVIVDLAEYKDMLASFTLTEEGLISEIVMPVSYEYQEGRANGRLGIFYQAEEASYLGTGFDGKAFTSANTPKLFYISPDQNVEERARYLIKSATSLANDTKITGLYAYNTDPESVQAQYFVLKANNFTTHSVNTRNTTYIIVQSVKQALNSEGDPVIRISGIELAAQNGAQTQVEYESSTGAFSNMIPYVGNTKEYAKNDRYAVQEGDIINIFEANGNVEYASLVYRQDMNYGINPRKMQGALAGQQNGLFDTSGKGNPYAVSSSGAVLTLNGFTINANESQGTNAEKPRTILRLFDGFAVRNKDTLLTITNQDLSDPAQVYSATNPAYIVNSYKIPANITTITLKNGKLSSVAKGTAADIKTYDDYGYKCSRILMQSYQANVYKLIVINVAD